jgi:hypothetical protein
MYYAWLDYMKEIPEDKQDKYRHRGIYGIWIEDRLVYIGKSNYMLRRICEHMLGIDRNQKENKYKVLREAVNKRLKVRFDVLMYTDTEETTGYWEGVLIRQYAPELNY